MTNQINSPYTSHEIDAIRNLYPMGGARAVMTTIKRSQDSVRHTAKKLGVKYLLRSLGNQQDVSDLTKPTTPQAAYILGLLWADGTVRKSARNNTVSLTLKRSDFEDVASLFEDWKFYKVEYKKHPSWQILSRVTLNHKGLVHFLAKNDYCEKSLCSPVKILLIIPEPLRRYFFRGWFDGDGHNNCLRKGSCSCSIAGSFHQDWSSLARLCNELGAVYTIKQSQFDCGRSSAFYLSGQKSSLVFFHYIYHGDSFGLSRKRLNWEDYKLRYIELIHERSGQPSCIYKRGATYSVAFTVERKNVHLLTTPSLSEAISARDAFMWKQYDKDETMLIHPEKYVPNYFKTLGVPERMLN